MARPLYKIKPHKVFSDYDGIQVATYTTKDLYKLYQREGGTLEYSKYKQIIDEYYKKVSILILTGYIYEIPSGIGTVKIMLNKRRITLKENGNLKSAVNWGESNKYKQRLLDEGKLLYEETTLESGEVINNGGEKWLCYHIDEFYPVWVKLMGISLHNAWRYKFDATWANDRAACQIPKEDQDLLYNKRQGNGTRWDYLKRLLNTANRQHV